MNQYTTPYCPASIGTPVGEVDTPALLVDLDAFEHNVALMQDFADRAGMKLRPHAKTHKCADIALRQMQAGAEGVCCQKLSEAERLAAQGVSNILISNQVVGATKLRRLPSSWIQRACCQSVSPGGTGTPPVMTLPTSPSA